MCDLKITLAADSFVLSGVWTPVVALFTQFVDNSLCQFTRFVDQVQIRRILDVYRCRRSGFTSCFSLLHDRSDQEFPWSARPRVLYGHSTLLLLDHGFWSVGHTLTPPLPRRQDRPFSPSGFPDSDTRKNTDRSPAILCSETFFNTSLFPYCTVILVFQE